MAKKNTRGTKKSKQISTNSKFSKITHSRIAVFAILFAIIGVSLLVFTNAQNRPFVLKKFQDHPGRGVSWAGLREPGPGSKCPIELLEAVDKDGVVRGCTHGPDPAPDGVDATQSVEPLNSGDSGASAGSIICEGDGTSGARVQMIYARASDKPDRFDQFALSFQQYAANMNNIFVESGQQNGQPKSVRFVHDASCNVVIARVTLPTTADDSIGNLASELIKQGFTGTERKYITWLDATPFCGMGYIMSDDRPTADNKHNFGNPTGPAYGAVGSGCWGGSTATHELVHTLGGVQRSAPHATSAYHCTDEYDVECYNDGTGASLIYNCPSTEASRLDCGKDDYFSTQPQTGSYLALKWNVANSRFLFNGGVPSGSSSTTPPASPSTDLTVPVVTISSPGEGLVIGSRVTVNAAATDNVRVTKIEIYIDGTLRTSVAGSSASLNWNSRRASIGTHFIMVKAYDAAGNVAQRSVSVIKN